MQRLLVGCAGLLLACCTAAVAAREWTDSTGKFKVEAELVATKDGKAILKQPDGSFLAITIEKLSEADRTFVKTNPPIDLSAASNTTPPPRVPNTTPKIEPKTDDASEVRRWPDQGWGVKSLAFSPDGSMLASGKADRVLELLDLVEGSRLDRVEKLDAMQGVEPCLFVPSGKKLLAGGRSGEIKIWDVNARKLKSAGSFTGHAKQPTCLAISPDAVYALSGGEDKKVHYWEVETGKSLAEFDGFDGKLKACGFSRDGETGYATDGAMLVKLNLKQKTAGSRVPLCGSWASGQFAAFSPHSLLVAAGDSYDIRLWNVQTGKEIEPKLEDREIQWSGEFTPDGTRLVSGGRGKINVWDVKKLAKITSLPTAGTGYIQCLAISPDSAQVAAIPSSAGQVLQVLRISKD